MKHDILNLHKSVWEGDVTNNYVRARSPIRQKREIFGLPLVRHNFHERVRTCTVSASIECSCTYPRVKPLSF